MKNRISKISILSFLLIICLVLPVFADILPAEDPGWYVTLNGAGKMESNFSSDQLDEVVSGMQPGDEAVFKIQVNNNYNDNIDWYMENSVLYSLEDRSANAQTLGGGYTYTLTYTGTDGTVNSLFDSNTVGGDTVSAAGKGLNEATSGLKDWFLLEKMAANTKGTVELHVILDGETQGNNYQDTLADLKFKFAAELPSKQLVGSPKTGDTNRILPYVIIMAAAAIFAVLAFFLLLKQRRKEAAGSGAEAAQNEQRSRKS